MINFEGYSRRIDKINSVLGEYGIESLEAVQQIVSDKGIDVRSIVLGIQPIAFENAVWAYTVGAAIAIKAGAKNAAEAAEYIGKGLQAFCIPGSVADQRKVGLGHGNLGAMLLNENTKCFAFLAGHESFARCPKVQSELQKPQTRFARLRLRSSLTDSAKMPLTLSPASTASPLLKQTMITTPASFISSAKKHSAAVNAAQFAVTVRTM